MFLFIVQMVQKDSRYVTLKMKKIIQISMVIILILTFIITSVMAYTGFSVQEEIALYKMGNANWNYLTINVSGNVVEGMFLNKNLAINHLSSYAVQNGAFNLAVEPNSTANLFTATGDTKSFQMIKFSPNRIDYPWWNVIGANMGKMTLFTYKDDNESLTNIDFTFVTDVDRNPDNSLAGFQNKTTVMTIANEEVRMFKDVNMTRNLHVQKNITGNNHFGGMRIYDDTVTINIIATDTWANVTSFTEDNETNGIEMQSDNITLKVIVPGYYRIFHTESYQDSPNIEFQFGISVNDIPLNDCKTDRKIGASGDVGDSTGSCTYRLNKNDEIKVIVQNLDSAADPTIRQTHVFVQRLMN